MGEFIGFGMVVTGFGLIGIGIFMLRESRPFKSVVEYKSYDFCKSVECGLVDECQNKTVTICNRSAKNFHKWLEENDYKIVKC